MQIPAFGRFVKMLIVLLSDCKKKRREKEILSYFGTNDVIFFIYRQIPSL